MGRRAEHAPPATLALLADGISIKEIADKLCITHKTVESHKYNIMEKLGAEPLADRTEIAVKKKLIEP
jgi:DNA-binding NarL/FixJ family response regulator